MEMLTIKKIGDDYGGDNLLFTFHITKKRHIKSFEGLGYEVGDILNNLYHEGQNWEWFYEWSYDNLDYNGLFLSTVYIDKENLYHIIKNNEIIITDDSIIDIIMIECEEVLDNIQRIYQEKLWSKIDYEDDIYEQFLDSEEVSIGELNNLEQLANGDITIKEFADKEGYEW